MKGVELKLSENVTYFGETDFRGKKTPFGIKREDRSRHVYIIGKTGMGKSTVLENMAAQDILRGEGMAFFDPHGSAIETLIDYIPENRIKDVLYFAPFDIENPVAFNVMESVDHHQRHLVAAGLMSIFKKIWVDAWSARMEYILNNTILALLEYPDSSLLGVNRMLSDKGFRQEVVSKVTDPSVKAFWVDEYGKWDEKYAREAGAAIQNKIGQFTSNPIIRNIIGQPKSSFDMREIIDGKKILLVNLSKGRIGEQNGNLLGGMLITKLYLAAMSRADSSKERLAELPPFFLFVDEFQNFANESFADILAEARKYKLNLTLAHQYIAQMEETVSDAVFGNVGTTIAFRVGPIDAEMLEKVFAPVFTGEDLVNLGKFQIYLSLMIDGVGSKPFSATTMRPVAKPERSWREEVLKSSRDQFAKPVVEVENRIKDWVDTAFEYDNPKSKNRDFSQGGGMGQQRSFPPRQSNGGGNGNGGGGARSFNQREASGFSASGNNGNGNGSFPPRRPFSGSNFQDKPRTPISKPFVQAPRVREDIKPTQIKASDELTSMLDKFEVDRSTLASSPILKGKEFAQKESRVDVQGGLLSRVSGQDKKPSPLVRRDGTSEEKNSLKDALAKVMRDAPIKKEEPQKLETFVKKIEPESKKEEFKSVTVADNLPIEKRKVREVPEDILKKILE